MVNQIGDSAQLREWVRCLVIPYTETLAARRPPTWYARLNAQIMADPVLRNVQLEEAVSASLKQVIRSLEASTAELPAPVFRERALMAGHILIQTGADFERGLADKPRPAERHGERSAAGLLTPLSAFGRPPSLVRKRPARVNRTVRQPVEARRSHVPEAPSSMVDRVVLILSVFERSSSEALTAGQISVRSGIPRSSVHRILQQLVTARWLKRHEDGYALGLRMFEIGSLVAHRSRITSAARPFIHELAERTGQVVHLAVLDQQDVVYLDKVATAVADRAFADTLPSRVGGRLPAHCTAVGKALLAYSPGPPSTSTSRPACGGGRTRAWRRRPHRGGDRRDPQLRIRDRPRRNRARCRVRRRADPQLRRGRRRGLGLRAA